MEDFNGKEWIMYSDEVIITLLQQILGEIKLLRQEFSRGQSPEGTQVVGMPVVESHGSDQLVKIVDMEASEPELELREGGVECKSRPGIVAPSQGGSKAIQALHDTGIKVKRLRICPDGQSVVDSLSIYLGKRYASLKTVLARIKSKVAEGGDVSLSLRNEPQEVVSDVCQFCNRLFEMAYLRRYRYRKSPLYQVYLTVSPEPVAQSFFDGAWLERYALYVLTDLCMRRFGGDIDYVANPSVTLPNGDAFELDVFAVVKDLPVWIEAKSGDYQIHVAKYAKLARQFGLQERLVLLVSGCSDANCSDLAASYGIKVANCETLAQTLEQVLNG